MEKPEEWSGDQKNVFLLFWIAYCSWKLTVKVTVNVEERKNVSVFYPCLPYRKTTKKKMVAVTETACSSKDRTLRNSL